MLNLFKNTNKLQPKKAFESFLKEGILCFETIQYSPNKPDPKFINRITEQTLDL